MLLVFIIHCQTASQTPTIDATERFVNCCFVQGIEKRTINTKICEKSPHFWCTKIIKIGLGTSNKRLPPVIPAYKPHPYPIWLLCRAWMALVCGIGGDIVHYLPHTGVKITAIYRKNNVGEPNNLYSPSRWRCSLAKGIKWRVANGWWMWCPLEWVSEVCLSKYHVFWQLSVDDEPSALGTYTASDNAAERSKSSPIPMVTMAAMGARGWGVERC